MTHGLVTYNLRPIQCALVKELPIGRQQRGVIMIFEWDGEKTISSVQDYLIARSNIDKQQNSFLRHKIQDQSLGIIQFWLFINI